MLDTGLSKRSVSANTTVDGPSTDETNLAGPVSFFVFSSGVEALQDSDIQPLSMSGSGRVAFDQEMDPDASAESLFDSYFNLATPHAYSLSENLSTSIEVGLAEALFDFTKIGGPTIYSHSISSSSWVIDDGFGNPIMGVLGAGDYHLRARAGARPNDDGDGLLDAAFDFSLDLTAQSVPEPSSIALVALGALTLLGFRAPRRMRLRAQ